MARFCSLKRLSALLLVLLPFNPAPSSAQECEVTFYSRVGYQYPRAHVKQKAFPLGFEMSFRAGTTIADPDHYTDALNNIGDFFKGVGAFSQNILAKTGLVDGYDGGTSVPDLSR